MKLRNIIEKNFEFVGDKLSKKVREVYYDKNQNKAIYGTATPEEKEEAIATPACEQQAGEADPGDGDVGGCAR